MAKQYLGDPISRSRLVSLLQDDGFTREQAEYGADACRVNWNKQAVLKAKDHLRYPPVSRLRLVSWLQREGFTREQAEYGADASRVNWYTQAVIAANQRLRSPHLWSRLVLSVMLTAMEEFTAEEADYAVDHCNANWREMAVQMAIQFWKQRPYYKEELIGELEKHRFTREEAEYGVTKAGMK